MLLFDRLNISSVMVARGAINDPSIFSKAKVKLRENVVSNIEGISHVISWV